MHIAEVETFVVANPPPHFGGPYFTFIKLTTGDGIVGYGEVYAGNFHPDVVAAGIRDVAESHLVGKSPFDIEQFWRSAYGRGFTLRPDVTLQGVMSGLEMACWDLIGKALGQPVYNLLGGQVHDRLRSYSYLYPEDGDRTDVYADPDLAAERAAEYVELGFTAVKFDPAGPYTVMGGHQPSLKRLELSVEFVRKIREAVGSQADILFGTHGQFTPSGAARLAARLEPYEPLWFEEPTPPDDVAGMAHVARHTNIPIAAGERLTTKSEFARLLEAGAANILQPNLGRAGGILEGKKIASLAEAHNAQIAPHLYCGPIVGAANIQLATCSPNFLILEGIYDWSGFHSEILKSPVQWEAGWVIPPTAPGLGVELDEEVARANPYAGDALHLNMAETSIYESD
ncbi:MAG: mandelate racemase/muconate lactonizing enzyme family protein [Acidimicrobiia bacterium]